MKIRENRLFRIMVTGGCFFLIIPLFSLPAGVNSSRFEIFDGARRVKEEPFTPRQVAMGMFMIGKLLIMQASRRDLRKNLCPYQKP